MSASGAFVICQGDPSQSCCWEQCILDAGCTCGKWLFGMGLLEPRIMHAGCEVRSRRAAFDAAGRRRTMHRGCRGHLRKVAFDGAGGALRTMHAGCQVRLRKAAFDDAAGAKNEACGMPSALVGSGFDDAAVVGMSCFFCERLC